MPSTYIQTGTRIRVYDSSVQTHPSLPLGTYRVTFSPKDGFSLLSIPDLSIGTERIYGDRSDRVNKIFKTFKRADRGVGALISGDKGQGKSLFLRMVAERALAEGMPVILISEDFDGLADFLSSLDECLVIFDEFEKIFHNGRRGRDEFESGNRQNQFLGLFDGQSSTKRIYCISVNDIDYLSNYIVNRPGRFHYHFRFDYPGPEEVRAYLREQAPTANPDEIEAAALFSREVNLPYDYLRAIAFEISEPEATFAEIIRDLNIKATDPQTYMVEMRLSGTKLIKGEVLVNLFNQRDQTITLSLRDNGQPVYLSFAPKDLSYEDDGSITLPLQKAHLVDQHDDEMDGELNSVKLSLVGQERFDFAA